MKYIKIIGYGGLIWVLMFAIMSAFVAFGVSDTLWVKIISIFIGGMIAFILAGLIKPASLAGALIVGLVWVVIGLALDFFISKYFAPDIFKMWNLWLGYFLTFIAPTLRVKKLAAGNSVTVFE
ncbi:MAG: hypothetical protein UU87_C0002G0008 [Parcubacteria group bacterium GW2011_GWA2_42_11]|nr:MAG: hypothetical protein UU87_C0002G0008 [Parcubacteria group bacterium GW2011_GWA2_42_11]